jgi:salicylate hydroxylase
MLGRRGISVTLLEREPEFTEGGYGLQLGPNITRMLMREGVFDTVRDLAVFPKRLVFRNAVTGEQLNYLDCDDMERRYGARYMVMHRNDLLQALIKAARETGLVTFVNSARVVDFTDHGDGVSVTTQEGDVYRGDVLLAADGIHSLVRRRWIGDETQATGFVAYRGTIPIERVDPTVSLDEVVCWMGPNLHLMQYPLRGKTEYNQVAVFQSKAYQRGEADWGSREELLDTFEGLYPSVAEAPRGLGMARGWPMVDRAPLDSWTRGRVALLGDAAHATLQYLAQGAGQSLLDASSLASQLAMIGEGEWTGEAISAAWKRYEDERLEMGSRVQRTSRFWGEIWHVDNVGASLLRDYTFKGIDRYDYSLVDWLYGPSGPLGDENERQSASHDVASS